MRRSWRTLANPRQRRVLDRLCGRWLKARGYSADSSETGKAKVSVPELVRSEVDIMVGRATFLIRTTSLRYPETARALKRILGLPADAPAGATAWADATPTQPNAKRPGEPHITQNEANCGQPEVKARETHTS